MSIGSLGSWIRKELYLPSEGVVENKFKDSLDEALVGVVQPKGQNTIVSSSSGNLGPKFYHHEEDSEYVKWLIEYPESECDILTTSHHPCLTNERLSFRGEDELSVESCEDLDEEGLISGKLTFWVGSEHELEMDEMDVDGTQDDETILEASKLEEPLQFNTISTGVMLGEDVDDYPNVSK